MTNGMSSVGMQEIPPGPRQDTQPALDNLLMRKPVSSWAVDRLIRRVRKTTRSPLKDALDPARYFQKYRFLRNFLAEHVAVCVGNDIPDAREIRGYIINDPLVQRALLLEVFYDSIPQVPPQEFDELFWDYEHGQEPMPEIAKTVRAVFKEREVKQNGIKYREDGTAEPAHAINVGRRSLEGITATMLNSEKTAMQTSGNGPYRVSCKDIVIRLVSCCIHDLRENTGLSAEELRENLRKTISLYENGHTYLKHVKQNTSRPLFVFTPEQAEDAIDDIVRMNHALTIKKDEGEHYGQYCRRLATENAPEPSKRDRRAPQAGNVAEERQELPLQQILTKAADGTENNIRLDYRRETLQQYKSLGDKVSATLNKYISHAKGQAIRLLTGGNPFSHNGIRLSHFRKSLPFLRSEERYPSTGWESEEYFSHFKKLKSSLKSFVQLDTLSWYLQQQAHPEVAYWREAMADTIQQRLLRVEYRLLKRHMTISPDDEDDLVEIWEHNFNGYDRKLQRFGYKPVTLHREEKDNEHKGERYILDWQQKKWYEKWYTTIQEAFEMEYLPGAPDAAVIARPFDVFAKNFIDFAVAESIEEGTLFKETPRSRQEPTGGMIHRWMDAIMQSHDPDRKPQYEERIRELKHNYTLQYMFTKTFTALTRKYLDDPTFLFKWDPRRHTQGGEH